MESVGAYEAKTHLPQLLDRVARGEEIQITRNGRPVARLVPEPVEETTDIRSVIRFPVHEFSSNAVPRFSPLPLALIQWRLPH